MDAALRLFLERGYVTTTIEAIAREAAVAPATVYQAFGSRQAILTRVLDMTIAGDTRAAAADPGIRQLLREDDQRRQFTQRALVYLVIGGDSLRAGCDRNHAAATFFAMVNSNCCQLLAGRLGWSLDDWQRWLTEVLTRELFGES